MNIDRIVFAVAGTIIILSVILAVSHSIYWLWFTAFVGANLTQAVFTGFYPLALVLKLMGIKSGKAF